MGHDISEFAQDHFPAKLCGGNSSAASHGTAGSPSCGADDGPAQLRKDFKTVVQEGARLRARLPAFLARRRALLDESCLLIGPLQALVLGYEQPTTTEELWATGLGAA
jgi:hypothetical protein